MIAVDEVRKYCRLAIMIITLLKNQLIFILHTAVLILISIRSDRGAGSTATFQFGVPSCGEPEFGTPVSEIHQNCQERADGHRGMVSAERPKPRSLAGGPDAWETVSEAEALYLCAWAVLLVLAEYQSFDAWRRGGCSCQGRHEERCGRSFPREALISSSSFVATLAKALDAQTVPCFAVEQGQGSIHVVLGVVYNEVTPC